MKNDKSDSTTDSSEDSPVDHRRLRLAGNQNATKLERKIEIGWFDFDFIYVVRCKAIKEDIIHFNLYFDI